MLLGFTGHYQFISLLHKHIVVVFIGDGTLGEGVLYETLNIVSKWELPLFTVLENNRYAQSTKIEFTLAGGILERFTAFGIETSEIESFDVMEINKVSLDLINKVRITNKPQCLIINTYRFASHSKSDDGRSRREVEKWKINDPLMIIEKELDKKLINALQLEVKTFVSSEINKAILAAMAE